MFPPFDFLIEEEEEEEEIIIPFKKIEGGNIYSLISHNIYSLISHNIYSLKPKKMLNNTSCFLINI
jgi:hypothetical protein